MSQRSSADALDLEAQQESPLLDAGGAPRIRWKQVFLALKGKMRTANNTEIKARDFAVDDRDVESWQPALLDASTELPDTGGLELTLQLDINNGCSNHEATVVVLQRGDIVRMITEKDLARLQEFGGVEGVAEALNSNTVNGIPAHEPESDAHNRRFIHFLGKSCKNSTILLLLILAILLFAFGIKEKGLRTGWYEGALTLGAVILIVMVHSVCEYRNESSRQLTRNQPWQNLKLEVRVLRGGFLRTICISEVLLGDIVLLEKGDQVPADGLLAPTRSLEVSEKGDDIINNQNPFWGDIALLDKEDQVPARTEFLEVSGESDAIVNNQNPFLFYGSEVIYGAGYMLVTSVGAETKLGNTTRTAQKSKRTPVENQLNELSTRSQRIAVVISIIIIVLSFLRFNLKKEHEKLGISDFSGKTHSLKELLEAMRRVALRSSGMLNMLTPFTLLLVGIAEGLPLAIAIAITRWNKRMLSDKTFAQEPSVTVTMASVTVICIDKTGGLPLIPQAVERGWIGEEVISGDPEVPSHAREALFDGIGVWSLLAENSQTSMDNSILSWAAENWGLETENWKQRHRNFTFEWPTGSENIIAALVEKNEGKGPRFLHFKGPAKQILDMCSEVYDIKGKPRPMAIDEKKFFEKIIEQMLSDGVESIAFAHKQVNSGSDEGNITMLGLLGLKKDIREVVNKCREAGIKVVWVSSETEVIPPDSDARIITGESFRNSPVDQRMDMAASISVMGNSLPSDWLLLVNCLKDQGHTVAVVGNRTVDIPTLQAADVGLTFATGSTEIVRNSADIVMKGDDFKPISAIIECGRCIYTDMQKYIRFQLTMTLAGLLIPLITDASHGSSPITMVQLHWAISVLTLLGGLALLTEPPDDMLMKKFTLGADKQLITKAMWVNIFIQAASQASVLAIIQSKGPTILRLNKKVIETMIFNSFFLCQVFNMFNAREPEKNNIFGGVHRGKWFWAGVAGASLLQVGYLETAHAIAGGPRLTYAEWGMCLLVGMISWCIDLTGKCILLMSKKGLPKPPGSAVLDPARSLEHPLMPKVSS